MIKKTENPIYREHREAIEQQQTSYDFSLQYLQMFFPIELCEKILEEAGFLIPKKLQYPSLFSG